jgi:hypothetical protein
MKASSDAGITTQNVANDKEGTLQSGQNDEQLSNDVELLSGL